MDKPDLTEREKFDAVMYQQFIPTPPKRPKVKRGWQMLGYLIIALFAAIILSVIFGQ
jgi:hypothetical protein